MELISVERRSDLLKAAHRLDKMELRDHYAVDADVIQAWRDGDTAATARVVEPLASRMAAEVASGIASRRIKVVSEPMSEYHRFILDISENLVAAGENIRWLSRRLTSTVLLPGNDFFVLDDQSVIFNVLDGRDDRAEQQLYTDPDVVRMCRKAFDTAWPLAQPYNEYCA